MTSLSSSATASLHSGSSRISSESTFTPKPMWRCSSSETFFMPALKPGRSSRSVR